MITSFNKGSIPYAVTDISDSSLSLLADSGDDDRIAALMKDNGWKKTGDHDKYLYGMHPVFNYSKDALKAYIFFQLACRSTLNNAWVPLDRCINIGALERRIKDPEYGYMLSGEDMTCYLLAKAVYTDKRFSDTSISMIEKSMAGSDRDVLVPKLEKVFFRFTDKLLSMLESGQYDSITEALFSYAGY